MSSATAHLPTNLNEQSRGARRSSGVRTHIGVLVHRARLDRRLAEGVDPATSRELTLRARQITRESYRHSLASSFEEVLASADRPSPRLSSAVPPARREVRAARAALLDLCRALREDAVVEPAGIALAQQLLTDGTGPLYIESHNDALWHAVRRAVAALDGRA